MTDEDISGNDESMEPSREMQDISTKELVDSDYEIGFQNERNSSDTQADPRVEYDHPGVIPDPGRTRHDDSEDASSEDTERTDTGYQFTGYETGSATRVGKPGDDGYSKHLERLNEGRDSTDSPLSPQQHEWDKKRFSQAICSALPISKREREQVIAAMEEIEPERFGHHKRIEKVCLGVVSVIVDKERSKQIDDPDELTLIQWEEEFKEIREREGVSMGDLSTIKQTVHDELGSHPPEPNPAGIRRDTNLPKTSPSELPDEYWQKREASYWESLAKGWEYRREEFKEALPKDKRERIELLRKWEPWKRDDEPTNEQPQQREQDPTFEPEFEELEEDLELEEDVIAEAERLIEEMEEIEE